MCFLSKAANLAVLMLVAANAWRNFAHRARSCRSIAIATKPSAVRVGYRYLTPACNTPAGYLGRQCVCRRCYSDESTWGTIGPNGDVRQYALNVDNNNSTSRNYSSSIEKGTKKNLDDVGSTDWYELLALVKSRNFDAAMAMYDQLDLKAIPIKQRRKMLFLSISACYKKDHLRKAKKIIDDMTDNDVVLTEQCYLSLIRCYSDGMMIDEAVATIKLMTRLEIEPKIRNLHPIIEAACNYNNAVIGEDTISDVVGNTASTNTVGATSASSGNSKDGALKVLEILQLAKDLNIKIWSEHIVLFIEMLSRSNILMNDEKLRAVANEMISELSSDITEVPVDQVVRIAKAVHGYYNVCSNSGTQNNSMKCMDEEVLVNSVHDIVDQIVDKSQLGIDGSLIAVNTNITDRNTRGSYFQNLFWNGKDILLNTTKISSNSSGIDSESDNDLDVMEDKSDEGIDGIDNLVLPPVPIKYYVKEEMKSLGIYTLEDNTHSKLVSISDEDSVCPNCKNVLESIRITNEEKLKVKQALISIVEEISEKQKSHLETFDNWLRAQPDFEYVVDAANVAYSHQNFATGRFSYIQIELVVDKLASLGRKVLVILPFCYAQQTIPNSTRKKRGKKIKKTEQLSLDDQRIIDKLRREHLLYVVPPGANDDWYWMYSTVYNVTSSLTSVDVDVSYDGPFPVKYVVTNDLMRDHRVAFLEPRPFMRWRNTQIVYFGLSKAAVATDYLQLLNSTSDGLIGSNSSTTVNATDSDNSVSTSSSLSEPNAVLDAHSDGVVIQGISQEDLDGECTNSTAPEYRPPVVYLYEPGNYSREIQNHEGNRWHIPAKDRNYWLCMQL